MSTVVNGYLTAQHRDAADGGCPSAPLVIDLRGFTDALLREAALNSTSLDTGLARRQVIAVFSQIVGALSRAVVRADPDLSDQILTANRQDLDNREHNHP